MPAPGSAKGLDLAVALLGVPVRIRCDSPGLAERLAVCYACSPRTGDERGEPLEAELLQADGCHVVRVTGREPREVADRTEALRGLNHELMHGVMLRAPELYYVHAAVVALGEKGVVLPGLSRAGKSTLALALVLEGAGFLSDELLAFDPAAGRARAFPRAIKVRDTCLAYFPELDGSYVGHGEGRFLPFSELPAEVAVDRAPIEAVVLPHWSGTDGPTELRERSPGEALLELAASSLNFGTHRTRSLDHLAELVSGARAFALPWSEPRSAARLVLEALS